MPFNYRTLCSNPSQSICNSKFLPYLQPSRRFHLHRVKAMAQVSKCLSRYVLMFVGVHRDTVINFPQCSSLLCNLLQAVGGLHFDECSSLVTFCRFLTLPLLNEFPSYISIRHYFDFGQAMFHSRRIIDTQLGYYWFSMLYCYWQPLLHSYQATLPDRAHSIRVTLFVHRYGCRYAVLCFLTSAGSDIAWERRVKYTKSGW